MNQKPLSAVSPNTLPTGHTVSRTWKLGALTLAAALAMTFAPRVLAAPVPESLSRPQLSAQASVESVRRYIALHQGDVAPVRGLSAAEVSVRNYFLDHGIPLPR